MQSLEQKLKESHTGQAGEGERQSAFYELLLDVAPASHHYDDEPILQLRKPER